MSLGCAIVFFRVIRRISVGVRAKASALASVAKVLFAPPVSVSGWSGGKFLLSSALPPGAPS